MSKRDEIVELMASVVVSDHLTRDNTAALQNMDAALKALEEAGYEIEGGMYETVMPNEPTDGMSKRDDDWKKFEPVEDIEVMLSTCELAILCNAAVLKGQSLQDFVFLAARDAANAILNDVRRDDDICSGVKVYPEETDK